MAPYPSTGQRWPLAEASSTPLIGLDFSPISGGTYNQSSVYSGNTAAANSNMENSTDGVVSTSTTATATNIEPSPFIRIDYGAAISIGCAMIRCPDNNVAGGFATTQYLKGSYVQTSNDGSTWDSRGFLYQSGDVLGALDVPAYRLVAGRLSRVFIGASARFVRVAKPGVTQYIALQDFFCTAGF